MSEFCTDGCRCARCGSESNIYETNDHIDSLIKEIAELRAENARLQEQVLDWKKWPGERPGEPGDYYTLMVSTWDGHSRWCLKHSKHEWAEIPRTHGADWDKSDR